MRRLSLSLGLILAVGPLARADETVELPAAVQRTVEFAEVTAIFAKSCTKCHGAEKQQSGLRLDRQADAERGGDNGPVYAAGKSAESLLIKLVAGVDPDVVMPPAGDRLTKDQVALLRGWIDQGAKWPAGADVAAKVTSNHWAFQPVKRFEPPVVKREDWVRNPIDRFILAKLEEAGVAPSPEADRVTLIRRLSLDLLGLPPRAEWVAEFVNDQRPDAYEQLVNKLLDSPHFGERWGRHWLDQARYADSDGYEKDNQRPFAYRYRDWVVDAVNRDLPFDQFTIEQLAGDLLPNATLAQKMATGFHRNTLTNTEGGTDQEEFRVAATVDRLNTLGTVWLGLTIGCAQCHTHKYDPVTQREYYQLFAYLNSISEVNIPAPTPDEEAAYLLAKSVYDQAHAPLAAALAADEKNHLATRQAEWERTFDPQKSSWSVPEVKSVQTESPDVKPALQADGSWLFGGAVPDGETYTLDIHTPATQLTGLRLEVLTDDALPSKGPGRSDNGNFVLSEVEVLAGPLDGSAAPAPIPLATARADFEQGNPAKPDFPAVHVLDGNPKTGWAVAGKIGQPHTLIAEAKTPFGFPGGTKLTVRLVQKYGTKHTIGRFRIALTGAAPPLKFDTIPAELPAAIATSSDQRNEAQRKLIADYFKTVDLTYLKLKAAADEHAKFAPPDPPTKAQTVAELGQPRKTQIHLRGDFLQKGPEVAPATLAVLPPLVAAPDVPPRLALARWVVAHDNPLTPRVTANLWWQQLFGRALVKSVDDFGLRGETPSHPELLDWLASELIARKWSRKEFVRLVVQSATYRQSSKARPDLDELDPKNNLLAHQNRYRLEAEIVRDLYLTASGLLAPQVGGPSVRPPLPPGIAELGYAGSVKWPESQGPDRYRRGMYIFLQRTVPYPMLSTFDAPDSSLTCVRRERSNTPLQALTLLNDPVFVECAQALGNGLAAKKLPPADLVRETFRSALSREPGPSEQARLESLYHELTDLAKQNPEAAAKLAGSRKPADVDPIQAAVAVALARVVLNLDEFVTRE